MMRVVAILLLIFFQYSHAQEQYLELLSKDDLRCIFDSQEETALDRWLQCLQPSSEESMDDIDLQNITLEHDILLPIQQPALESGEMSNDAIGRTAPPRDVEIDSLPSADTASSDSAVDTVTSVFSEENERDPKISRSEKAIDSIDIPAQKRRWAEGLPLWGWMKANFIVLVFVKLLLTFIGSRGIEKNTKTEKEEESKKPAGVVFEKTIGAPLGSAVAIVFAEVILSNSGCSLPAEKIYTLFEDSLRESLAEVGSDIECSKVADDFLTSFKKRYASFYRIQKALSNSQYKANAGSNQFSSHSMECESPLNLKQQSDYNMEKSVSLVDRTLNDDSLENSMCTPKKSIDRSESAVFVDLPSNRDNDYTVSSPAAQRSSKANVKNTPCHYNCTTCTPNGTKRGRFTTQKPSDHDDYSTSTPVVRRSNILSQRTSPEPNALAFEHGDNYEHIELRFQKSEPQVENVRIVSCIDRVESRTYPEYEVEYASSISDETKAVGEMDVALLGQSYAPVPSNFQRDYLTFFERYVVAQEQQNRIRSVELVHMMKQQTLEQEKIQLTSVSNDLMRENIELSKSKACFKESTVLEEKERAAHVLFITTCADELGAGLFVMLVSLTYGAWKYSFSLLNNLMATCQTPVRAQRRTVGFGMDWFYSSVDSVGDKLQTFVCQITVTGRILVGCVLVIVVAFTLLRKSVTSSSQAMPATIIIVLLGGICGAVGKVSVDSLGGNGIKWLLLWEMFCTLHFLASCFTPIMYKILHGPSKGNSKLRIPFWARRAGFHAMLVFVLPILAGQLPFGSFRQISKDLIQASIEFSYSAFNSVSEYLQASSVV